MLAPTGTISFMMDCDTTGVEPDFLARQVEEARRRRRDHDREQDRADGARQARLRAERDRGGGRVHRRAEHDRRRALRQERALSGLRLRDRRARDPLHGAREDDGRCPPVHLRRDLEDGQPARRGDGRGRVAAARSSRGCSASRRSRSTATTARSRSLSGSGEKAAARCSRSHRSPGAAAEAAPGAGDRIEVGRKFKVGDYEGYIHVGLFEDAPRATSSSTSPRRARPSQA